MSAAAKIIPLHKETQPFYVPAFELHVKGRPVPVRDVIEVRYEDGIEKIDGFTLTVNNWDTVTQKPLYYGHEANAGIFVPGNKIRLYMGYQGDLRLMMTGLITSIDVQFPESGSSRIVVSGLNVLERFRRTQYTWSWPEEKKEGIRDSEVAKLLERQPDDKAGRPGLGVEVRTDKAAAGKEPLLPNIYMNNQFPIIFLMERARRCGYEVLAGEEDRGGSEPHSYLYFGPTNSLRDVTYELEWGKSLVSFHPTFASAQQIFAVKVCGWDRTAKKRIEERRTLDDLKDVAPNRDHIVVARTANREEVITDPPARTVEEAKKRADEVLKKSIGRMVEATGTTVGLPDLRGGKSVSITRTGVQFDGLYTVLSSTHTLDSSGYRTNFTARRVEPPANKRR
ncbi:Phage protein D-like protein [Mesorhizobium prunaredense]|uniref:Phage protein D-like protein n=1 Tax=Mesorhizobium prunaredense TaxID=1631249 RepID=A0A1R3VFD6_9HYPH|nr:phage late control D family protein [Mesorhizobium prunaredense]SIT58619.1 Phage protein D-like protein [Mesorhizobium prunaredense]